MNVPNVQPVLFLSHGSPLHAVLDSEPARAWAALGAQLPTPRAIIAVSAHWNTGIPMLTGAASPPTIHDFGGFPDVLYRLRYPASGAPELAEQARGLLRDAGLPVGIDGSRGLDHGAWVPLMHMFPQANVPVIQLSVQPELCARHHFAVGRALAPLAADNVLIVASGHTTHNLRDAFRRPDLLGQSAEPMPYVKAFADWVADAIAAQRIDELLDWTERAPEPLRAHPSPEHFLPLFVALGAAGDAASATRFLDVFDGPALAMDSWRWDRLAAAA
ncbi:class III extradiol ring-cleavage dioxygenase [Niveibacterium umoris]|uniref:4,5-DOPA dioxygenase extradiol n=1 Tax=Niveibacterium umoris TaxID=1193620 RepID=A0A840BD01_9RHOO|nr:class III extradiol ring-cleavage dioxygenase [Niveibacterium umoris]MBB4010965.1 4,5-DOPA dioxygenase extradiol [Niveibacterium umoris]